MKKIQLILTAACALFITSSSAQQGRNTASFSADKGSATTAVEVQQLTKERPAELSSTNITMVSENEQIQKSKNAPTTKGRLQQAALQTDVPHTIPAKSTDYSNK